MQLNDVGLAGVSVYAYTFPGLSRSTHTAGDGSFGLGLERAFDATKYGRISDDPWLELTVPSVTDRSLAPDGQHVMSIYFHFAPRDLRGASWADHREPLYKAAMRVLEPHIRDLPSSISTCQVLTPEDLETTWGLSGGHIFHGEPTLDQWWIALFPGLAILTVVLGFNFVGDTLRDRVDPYHRRRRPRRWR